MAYLRMNPNFVQEMGRPENSRPWQREAGAAGRAAIAERAPVRFGTLAGTIFVSFEYDGRTTRIFYGSTRPYALFQEVGTGLYGPMRRYITPKRAKFLRWTSPTPGAPGGPNSGPVHFAKRVKGSPPTLFMFYGLDAVFGNAVSYAASGGIRK